MIKTYKTYKNVTLNYEVALNYETDPYATHQPLLIWCAENTSGNILELGTGDSSTSLLNSIIQNTDKKLLSVDDDENWLFRYNSLQSDNHKFIYTNSTVEAWKNTIDDLSNCIWSLVFIDHARLKHIWQVSRPYAVEKFLNCSEYIIFHDANLFPEIKTDKYYWYEYIPQNKASPEVNLPSTYLISAKNDLKNFTLDL